MPAGRRVRHARQRGALRDPDREAPRDRCRRASRCSCRATPSSCGEWDASRQEQRALYEAVTEYVREGYNQALREKRTAIGFLMILMQRLVTSSTAPSGRRWSGASRCSSNRRASSRCSARTSARTGSNSTARNRWSAAEDAAQGARNERAEVELLLSPHVAARPGARRQGRGAARVDPEPAARGERPGAEGPRVHRVRADPDRCSPSSCGSAATRSCA
jgi:hypothetical protein